MNIQQKEKFIKTALERETYSEENKKLWKKLSQNKKNYDSIIADINNYSFSTSGINQAHITHARNRVSKFKNPIMVTFTARSNLDQNEFEMNYRRFINSVSKKHFRMAYRRHHKRIENIGYFEGGDCNTKLHIHAVIEKPEHIDCQEFINSMKTNWFESTGFIHVQKYSCKLEQHKKVMDYITKLRTKESFQTLHDAFVIH